MSSIPGHTLEDYVTDNWYIHLVTDNSPPVEYEGSRVVNMTPEEFAPFLALYEPWREDIERWLDNYDEDTQSWRDYRSSPNYPEEVGKMGGVWLEKYKERKEIEHHRYLATIQYPCCKIALEKNDPIKYSTIIRCSRCTTEYVVESTTPGKDQVAIVPTMIGNCLKINFHCTHCEAYANLGVFHGIGKG